MVFVFVLVLLVCVTVLLLLVLAFVLLQRVYLCCDVSPLSGRAPVLIMCSLFV